MSNVFRSYCQSKKKKLPSNGKPSSMSHIKTFQVYLLHIQCSSRSWAVRFYIWERQYDSPCWKMVCQENVECAQTWHSKQHPACWICSGEKCIAEEIPCWSLKYRGRNSATYPSHEQVVDAHMRHFLHASEAQQLTDLATLEFFPSLSCAWLLRN